MTRQELVVLEEENHVNELVVPYLFAVVNVNSGLSMVVAVGFWSEAVSYEGLSNCLVPSYYYVYKESRSICLHKKDGRAFRLYLKTELLTYFLFSCWCIARARLRKLVSGKTRCYNHQLLTTCDFFLIDVNESSEFKFENQI